MAGIRTRDTAPELAVQRVSHRMRLRFRLHRKDLPGRPDLVWNCPDFVDTSLFGKEPR